MRVELESRDLVAALAQVASVVERANTVPILSNVLLEAEGEGLKLTGTNLAQWVSFAVPATVDEAGGTTASAARLGDIARQLRSGSRVSLATKDSRLVVTSGRSRLQLVTLPADDFPRGRDEDMPVTFALSADAWRRMFDATRHSVSTEASREMLTGVFLHVTPDALVAASTDGHRLARLRLPMPRDAAGMPDIILPRAAAATLRKMLDGRDGETEVHLSSSRLQVRAGDAMLTTQLIAGTYPNYTRMIPSGNDKVLRVCPKALGAAVSMVRTVSTDRTRGIRLAIDRDRVTVSASSHEHGAALEEVSAEYGAVPFEIGFNAAYLRDELAMAVGDTVEIIFADAVAPALFREPGSEARVGVLAPMRV